MNILTKPTYHHHHLRPLLGNRAGTLTTSASGAASGTDAWASGIDLDRYPVNDLSSPAGQKMLENARRALSTTGVATFPGFLREEVTRLATAEAAEAAKSAFICNSSHNAYQLPGIDPDLPETHVRNMMMRTRVASTAYDEVQGPLRRLYEYDGLVSFLSAVLGQPLHRLADPLGACSVNIFRPGWFHAWHFDESEYTTTLALQQSESGGDFEYTPPIRNDKDDMAADAVARIIRDHSAYEPHDVNEAMEPPPIATAPFEPGTLQVSPVASDRHNAP